ncbi:MAG: efflux RND transporter periplasmic adaptor subunit, partial [Symploca sp. SIO2G7]|nr:efflux RND transporter periplasmic adaptor subunit [Symploca sp. SIO2G7]
MVLHVSALVGKGRINGRWLWLPPVALLVLWLGRFWAGLAVAENGVSPLPVQTQVLERATQYQVERTYTGEIVAQRSSDLGFEQAGTLVEILVDEGDTVAKGEP